MTRNGIRVHMAKDGTETLVLVMNELGGSRLVVKSKSNLTKEVGFTELLEESGIRVIETDVGDRIIQIAHEKPSHPLVQPAILVQGTLRGFSQLILTGRFVPLLGK